MAMPGLIQRIGLENLRRCANIDNRNCIWLGLLKGEIFINELRVKHLEFIQSNISRMNQNSFQMKGWAITVLSALLAIFAASGNEEGKGNVAFLFVAIAPCFIFWLLDSYYLQQERKFRGVYNDVAELTNDSNRIKVLDFEMPLCKYHGGKYNFFKAMCSRTEWPLYLILIIGLFISGLILK